MTQLTYLEAAVVGLVQGVSEMFPVSSLGHNVLIPAIIGGSWARDLNVSATESPYLAFIVGLHVATAIALLIYFWRDWIRIIGGFFSSIRDRRVRTEDQKLAWMIILATIPVGIVGLLFEHAFRVIFGKPIIAGIFLAVNGVILIAGERYRSRASRAADAVIAAERDPGLIQAREPELVAAGRSPAGAHARAGTRTVRQQEQAEAIQADRRLAQMGYPRAVVVGSAQILALLAGISRDGVTMVAGMARGLSREDAARFAFLLATPVILAAGALKIPDLLGPLGSGIRGQILLGSVLSGVGAYLSVRFLLRYLRTRTLTPFGVYCLIAGVASVLYLGLVK
ncbi:MAG: undecaprenyl-diphosphatase [Streptosporangiaceae bacterium]|jgi:undecaprenyl-diphosphatase|nr:undecaprenyl-diphosphatase [Streptosporangiaceae bacterium]